MTNPNNAVGTNGAYGGRTSVNAFNDDLAPYSRGILSGWACSPDSGLTVTLGGDGITRDVAVAEDNAGNKTTINNISGSPISVTMDAAPGSNSRIDLVVAYVNNPPQGSSTVADNPAACGIIKVTGTAASTPIAPNDSAIRSAITADGASGTTAYYVILATITIASGTTDLTSDNIKAGVGSKIGSSNIDFSTFGDQTNYFDIGNIRVAFGSYTLQNVPNNTDTQSSEIPYGTTFASAPNVLVSVEAWLSLIMALSSAQTTTNFKVVLKHNQGTTLNIKFAWVAIGLKPN